MNEKINILVTLPMLESLFSPLNNISPKINIVFQNAKKATDISQEIWQNIEILYTLNVIPDIRMAPNLNWVQFHVAGVDDLVDSQLFFQQNILITTMSGIHAPVIGEYVLMMLLSQGHKLLEMRSYQSHNEWASDARLRFKPKEVRRSTVGIIGYGSVGREVARLVTHMGGSVLAVKNNWNEKKDHGFSLDGIGDPSGLLPEKFYSKENLLEFLPLCDFLVIAVPRTLQTTHMIGKEELAVMKPNSFIVDVSRGGVVDHQALIEALKEKKISGAAIDVFPEEPLLPASELWNLENVIITPHIAGVSQFYGARALKMFKKNLCLYLEEKPLLNQFNQKRGY